MFIFLTGCPNSGGNRAGSIFGPEPFDEQEVAFIYKGQLRAINHVSDTDLTLVGILRTSPEDGNELVVFWVSPDHADYDFLENAADSHIEIQLNANNFLVTLEDIIL